MYLEGDIAWFINREDNFLFQWDLKSETCEYITCMPGNKGWRSNSHCLKIENRIFFLPFKNNVLWIYDLESKTFTDIKVCDREPGNCVLEYIGIYNGYLYFVGKGLKQIFKITYDNLKIDRVFSICDQEDECGYEEVVIGRCVYCTGKNSNRICEFNIETEQTRYYCIDMLDKGINTICYDGRYFWLSGYEKEIVCWDLWEGKAERYNDFPEEFVVENTGNKKEPLFYQSVVCEKNIWFVPWNTMETRCSGLIAIDRSSKKIVEYRILGKNNMQAGAHALLYCRNNRFLGIYFREDQSIQEIDSVNFSVKEKYMYFHGNNYMRMWKKKYGTAVYTETNATDLDVLFEFSSDENTDEACINNYIGKQIYVKVTENLR